MLSLYFPGHSLLHRTPAWVKLILLCLTGTAIMLIANPLVLGISLFLILILYALGRVPVALIWRLSRVILIFALVITGIQWYFTSLEMAAVIGLRILVLVGAANLLSLTTPMSDLIASVESLLTPLARFGVHPERVSLAIALTLRFIPVLVEQGAAIRQAQAARGARGYSVYLMALIIRIIRLADGIGEALEVRSALGTPAKIAPVTTPRPHQ